MFRSEGERHGQSPCRADTRSRSLTIQYRFSRDRPMTGEGTHTATPSQGVVRARKPSIIMDSSSVIMRASHEWATRPDDQRYVSLDDLKHAVASRKGESWTATPAIRDLRVTPAENGNMAVELYDPTYGGRRTVNPTNWAFGQLAQYAKAPAAYLRELDPTLAAINVQWGLEHRALRPDALVLGQTNGDSYLRAMTSTSYGRIWDAQVVEAVERVNQSGRWQIPASTYGAKNPKRATTLYASDRDVFIFLVDPESQIDVGHGRMLHRGFYTWNSEVGSQIFGLCDFLYDFVCDNRMIWGATQIRELRIRHTSGAPERFAYEGAKYLTQYAQESTADVTAQIHRAQAFEIPKAAEKNGVEGWLQARGFTGAVAKSAVAAAQAEEGGARSLWDIVNGLTAHARTNPHTDERVTLEKQAGKLMEIVKA